jgi:UDP-N-acetyl-D-mannosaminuronic acid dehydrogenase
VVDTINRGEIHIEEVDLDGLVQGVVARGLLSASTEVEAADVFVIAVPTPFDQDHAPDISYVLAAGEAVAPVLKAGDVVILESTSPVGTTEAAARSDRRAPPDLKCPGLTAKRRTSRSPIARNACCPARSWKN